MNSVLDRSPVCYSGDSVKNQVLKALDNFLGVRYSHSVNLCRPGLRWGHAPSRASTTSSSSWLDRVIWRTVSSFDKRWLADTDDAHWLEQMDVLINELRRLQPQIRRARKNVLQHKLRRSTRLGEATDIVLAHTVLAAEQSLQLTARPNQLMAAKALMSGYFAEMATGEGKTLAVGLAAASIALSGTPVHVFTANEYLAERDRHALEAFYQSLGLSVAHIETGTGTPQRRAAYAADVVYLTAKQAAFDWLGDALEKGVESCSLSDCIKPLLSGKPCDHYQPVMRGLCFAIVDEADSLLIDEGRIPFVLARERHSEVNEEVNPAIALGIAEQLVEGDDFTIARHTNRVQITRAGRESIASLFRDFAHVWQSSRYREERVYQALTALYSYTLDRDYIVRDRHLELLDAHTGRPAPDRRLPHGLHKLLELKEKCLPTPEHETVATLPFHDLFRRYVNLVGISGTLNEIKSELLSTYNRLTVTIPRHRPRQLKVKPMEIYLDRPTLLNSMVDQLVELNQQGRPVLIGTRNVEQSLGVSALLSAHQLTHQILNAYQDKKEAEIVASAGNYGCITVATNMAGRGTDIPLGEGVADLGGLHVTCLAFNDARRLDRQLIGRVARQGDPGSCQHMLSLDDSNLVNTASPFTINLCQLCVKRGWQNVARWLVLLAQMQVEKAHYRERKSMYQTCLQHEKELAFAGKTELNS